MKKINLAISGCMGRMGQQLIKSSKKNKDIVIFTIKKIEENPITYGGEIDGKYSFKPIAEENHINIKYFL